MKVFRKHLALAKWASSIRTEQAFTLVSVLLLTGFLSALVLMITLSTRSSLNAVRVDQESLQARLAADAAISRIIIALENDKDPLHANLLTESRSETRIIFNETPIDVLILPEDGKLDINYAPLDHMGALLNRLGFDNSIVQLALSRLSDARSNNRLLFKALELLPENMRFSPSSALIRDFFTTLTGTRSFNPKTADFLVIETIPNISTTELDALFRFKQGVEDSGGLRILQAHAGRLNNASSSYQILANARLETGVTARREAGVLLQKSISSSATLIYLETAIGNNFQ